MHTMWSCRLTVMRIAIENKLGGVAMRNIPHPSEIGVGYLLIIPVFNK